MIKSDIAYAVVKVGGKQYKVVAGDVIVVDRSVRRVGEHSRSSRSPCVPMTAVSRSAPRPRRRSQATVAEHFLGEKIRVFTYKPKNTFKKTHGHRSRLSRLTIDAIEVAGKKEKKSGS